MTAPATQETDAKKPRVQAPYFQGGSTKGVTTVAVIYDNSRVESRDRSDGKGKTTPGSFVNAEMARFEGANEKQNPQWDPSYRSEQVVDDAGQTRYNTGVFYTDKELASFREAAGANVQPVYRFKDGKATDEKIGEVLVFDADVLFDRERGGVRINHKSAKETSVAVPSDVRDAQFQGRLADREVLTSRAAERRASKETENPAPQAEAPVASAPEANTSPDF